MSRNHRRIAREQKTLEAMIAIYCRGHHGTTSKPCEECQGLLDYGRQRLRKCPFGEDKPTCTKCPVHCYRPDMRERVRSVMRYAGPRMLRRHPVLAMFHVTDGLRKEQRRMREAD